MSGSIDEEACERLDGEETDCGTGNGEVYEIDNEQVILIDNEGEYENDNVAGNDYGEEGCDYENGI